MIFFASEVFAGFIPLRCSLEAVNCEVRQQYPLLLKPLVQHFLTQAAGCCVPCPVWVNGFLFHASHVIIGVSSSVSAPCRSLFHPQVVRLRFLVLWLVSRFRVGSPSSLGFVPPLGLSPSGLLWSFCRPLLLLRVSPVPPLPFLAFLSVLSVGAAVTSRFRVRCLSPPFPVPPVRCLASGFPLVVAVALLLPLPLLLPLVVAVESFLSLWFLLCLLLLPSALEALVPPVAYCPSRWWQRRWLPFPRRCLCRLVALMVLTRLSGLCVPVRGCCRLPLVRSAPVGRLLPVGQLLAFGRLPCPVVYGFLSLVRLVPLVCFLLCRRRFRVRLPAPGLPWLSPSAWVCGAQFGSRLA